MLFAQAQSLQAIFTGLAERAALNAGEYIGATDTYLRLALKAQAQCRATLETLAEIKNPQPTAFIRQQNIAANQQVNNCAASRVPISSQGTRVENPEKQSNELKAMTHAPSEWLDSGAAATAGAGNSALAAVGAIERA